MQYTVDYFIDKFEKIPEELWITGNWERDGGKCATGHCGYDSLENPCLTKENKDLFEIFKNSPLIYHDNESGFIDDKFDGDQFSWLVVFINDGNCQEYQQPTPKQRILAALRDVKNMQPRKDITASLAQDAVQERLDVVKAKEVERV